MSKERYKGKLSYVIKKIKEHEDKRSLEWRRTWQERIEDIFDDYSLIFGETTRSGEPVDIYIDFSPISNIFDIDDRLFFQLSPLEQQYVKNMFFKKLQFDPTNAKIEGEPYTSDNGKGTIITSYVTGISDTSGLYLHELKENSTIVDYVVAPLEYKI